jgi:glycosyltransferase involved in cell wall biosynthesis
VIPHGVNTRLYTPAGSEERAAMRRRLGLEQSLVIGTVAAHSLRKRFDLMVEAFAGLRRRRPDALFLIKTDRAVSLDGSDLLALGRRHGVGSAMRVLLDEYSPGAMVELYRSMDLYLNLSEWEGFCLPVLEAMACGVPVVTHPVQGAGEILPYRELLVGGSRRDEQEGVSLLRADPASAAGVLARAAGSPGLLEELGGRGRREAVLRYDLDRVVLRWEDLLTRLRERRG